MKMGTDLQKYESPLYDKLVLCKCILEYIEYNNSGSQLLEPVETGSRSLQLSLRRALPGFPICLRPPVQLTRVLGLGWVWVRAFFSKMVSNDPNFPSPRPPLVVRTTPLEEEFLVGTGVLGAGINGKVVECTDRWEGRKGMSDLISSKSEQETKMITTTPIFQFKNRNIYTLLSEKKAALLFLIRHCKTLLTLLTKSHCANGRGWLLWQVLHIWAELIEIWRVPWVYSWLL